MRETSHVPTRRFAGVLLLVTACAGFRTAVAPPPLPPQIPSGLEGTTSTQVRGCLAAPSESQAKLLAAQQAQTPRSSGSNAEVVPARGGVLATVDLEHACCLKYDGTTRIEGRRATLKGRVTGSPCGCTCRSTVLHAVALPEGAWTIVVQVSGIHDGEPLYQGRIEVK